MKRLSKAQTNELITIQKVYKTHLEMEKQSYNEAVTNYGTSTQFLLPLEYYTEHLKMANEGFILWQCPNSRTLERLAECGYIEYIKRDNNRNTPIDYIKLLDV